MVKRGFVVFSLLFFVSFILFASGVYAICPVGVSDGLGSCVYTVEGDKNDVALGFVSKSGTSWSVMVSSQTAEKFSGGVSDPTVNGPVNFISSSVSGNVYTLTRAVFPFDTSALPDDASIRGVKLHLVPSSVIATDSMTEDVLSLHRIILASPPNIASADFSKVVASIISSEVDVSTNVKKDQTLTFDISSRYFTTVNKVGFSSYAVKMKPDRTGGVIGPNAMMGAVSFYSSDYADFAKRPKLEIIYVEPASSPPTPPSCTSSTEVCDGKDNDCDNLIDEGLGSLSCGVGICMRTVDACLNGNPRACNPGNPTSEICTDGLDNDCDGTADSNDLDCHQSNSGALFGLESVGVTSMIRNYHIYNNLLVSGHFLYEKGTASGFAGLMVWDYSDPKHPILVKNYIPSDVSDPMKKAIIGDSYFSGMKSSGTKLLLYSPFESISYFNYQSKLGSGFQIVDKSDPYNLVFAGHVNLFEQGYSVRDAEIFGNRVYVVAGKIMNNAVVGNHLLVYDVSDINNPRKILERDISETIVDKISVEYLNDVRNPNSLIRKDLVNFRQIHYGNGNLFLTTQNGGIFVYSATDNPNLVASFPSQKELFKCWNRNDCQRATFKNNLFVLTSINKGGLSAYIAIIDTSNPAKPLKVYDDFMKDDRGYNLQLNTDFYLQALSYVIAKPILIGNKLYIFNTHHYQNEGKVYVYDLSEPGKPKYLKPISNKQIRESDMAYLEDVNGKKYMITYHQTHSPRTKVYEVLD